MPGKRLSRNIDCIEVPRSCRPEKPGVILRSASVTCLLSDSPIDSDVYLSPLNGDERKTIRYLFHVSLKRFQRFLKGASDKRDAYEPFSVKAMQLRDTMSHQRSEMLNNEPYSAVFF